MRHKHIYFTIIVVAIIIGLYYFSSSRFYSISFMADKSGNITVRDSEFWIYNPYLIEWLPFEYKRESVIKIRSQNKIIFPKDLVDYYKNLSDNDTNYRSSSGIFTINGSEPVDKVMGIVIFEINGKIRSKSICIDNHGILHDLGYLEK